MLDVATHVSTLDLTGQSAAGTDEDMATKKTTKKTTKKKRPRGRPKGSTSVEDPCVIPFKFYGPKALDRLVKKAERELRDADGNRLSKSAILRDAVFDYMKKRGIKAA